MIDRTFEYLLNAMERAASEPIPADHGYAEKRAAVFAHVTALRSTLSQVEGEKDEAVRVANHHCHVIQELQARVEGLTAENGRLTMELAAEIKGDGEFVEHAKRMVAAEKEKVAALTEVNETARQAIERHFLHSSPRKKAEALKAARAALGSHDGGARHG